MKIKNLQEAYNPETFRELGHKLIDTLANHLEKNLNDPHSKTMFWNTPDDEAHYWESFLKDGPKEELFQTIIDRSIHIHNPKYIGHQVNPTLPITGLSSILSSVLNNGMGVYEMGVASTAIEKVIVDFINQKVGYTNTASGYLTSGGTLANLTALLAARQNVDQKTWTEGTNKQLAIMVSDQAHYCVDRAARIMGLGDEGIIKIPTKPDFSVDIDMLKDLYQKTKSKGIEIIAIVGSAPSTSTGIYDDILSLATFCETHNVWFHIDGAHGGAAVFSKKYRYLLDGVEKADSIVIDGHKMLMMPALTTALLFKNGQHSYETFSQKADYLLNSSKEDWYNLAKRTFECTKYMMSLHWITILKYHGESIFDDFVTTLYDLGQEFYNILIDDPNFEVAVKPMSNIVCFRYVEKGKNNQTLNLINEKIRQEMLEDGTYYIVQTKLNGIVYLRATIMNPFTTQEHFKELLRLIKK